ncbi:hypothetical protein DT73_18755 [Mangrovibacter sp. MFB070]|nr:hypothetical protein DT73_18755 [Mangrovibacter sp. MFB070]
MQGCQSHLFIQEYMHEMYCSDSRKKELNAKDPVLFGKGLLNHLCQVTRGDYAISKTWECRPHAQFPAMAQWHH